MQVEGFTYPSNGRLTTSLIAPIAVASPPKFVELASEQRGNGKVRYRVGIALSPTGEQDLRALSQAVGQPLANGQVPVIPTNEHLHIYARTHDDEENVYVLHLVLENRPDGLIAADIGKISNGISVEHLAGLVSDQSQHFSQSGQSVPLTSLFGDRDNIIALHTYESEDVLIDLGKADELVVDCGVIDRVGDHFQTQRTPDGIRIFARDESGTRDDPFGCQPIATLERSHISSEFKYSLVPVQLKSEIAAGYVRPTPVASNSARGF